MNIEYSKKFDKAYRKLDSLIRKKSKERIKLFSENPFHPLLHNHSVDPPFTDARSINITGDYRAIFTREGENQFLFINIGTHSELYD